MRVAFIYYAVVTPRAVITGVLVVTAVSCS